MSIFRNSRGTDSQRSRLYRAENKAFYPLVKKLRDVSTPEKYEARVAEILSSRYMARMFPAAVKAGPVKLKITKRLRGARAGFEGITTNPRMMREDVLIHELAHTVIHRCWPKSVLKGEDGRDYRSDKEVPANVGYGLHYIVGHGPEYARVYLKLVRKFIGKEAYNALRASFVAHRVQFLSFKQLHRAGRFPKRKASEAARKARAKGLRKRAAEQLITKLNSKGELRWRIRGRDVLLICTPVIGRTTHYELIYRGNCVERFHVSARPTEVYEAVAHFKDEIKKALPAYSLHFLRNFEI